MSIIIILLKYYIRTSQLYDNRSLFSIMFHVYSIYYLILIEYIDFVDFVDFVNYKIAVLISVCFFIVKKKLFDGAIINDVIDDNISIKTFKIKFQIIK